MGGEAEGVDKVLIGVFYCFPFGFGHEVKVDGFTGNYGAEGAIFHDDYTIAELGDEEIGLGGEGLGFIGDGLGLFGGGGFGLLEGLGGLLGGLLELGLLLELLLGLLS